MLTGTICHYDKAGRSFGYIKVPGHERTIFFHNTRQRQFYCGLDAQIHCDLGWDREPQVGESVIITELKLLPKGPSAVNWALEKTMQDAVELQKLMPLYRFRHRKGRTKVSRLDPTPSIVTLYEGKSLIELIDKSAGKRIERDEFDYYWFETMNEDGVWEYCGDPRPQ